jgi:NAD(P)-dependent dehydrogenase (short-subunit alcohol dehydrogenase family)
LRAPDNSRGWVYRASKAALNMVVASAQHDYPKAIMVALSPGWVQTDMGGQDAPLTTIQSVTAMRATLAGLKPEHKVRLPRLRRPPLHLMVIIKVMQCF